MYYSFFEIFSIGVGPSSSHTVGPMRAAKRWLDSLHEQNLFEKVAKIDVVLYGSLALTGFGHGTVKAIVYGLMGLEAEAIDPEVPYVNAVEKDKMLHLGQERDIPLIWIIMLFLKKKFFCRNIPMGCASKLLMPKVTCCQMKFTFQLAAARLPARMKWLPAVSAPPTMCHMTLTAANS